MSQTTSARPGARTFVFVGAFVALLGVAGACSESQRANGDSCLKDEDCLSGICSGQVCVASQPLLDAAVDAEAGAVTADASDASSDAVADTATKDTSPPKEAAPEAAPEAATDSGSSEAGGDGATD